VASSFERDGRLACAPHAHTTNSDGEFAPGLLVRRQGWAGCDALTLTDARASEPGACS
jgi:predicted metal-dependent phosphoesterase TrpH